MTRISQAIVPALRAFALQGALYGALSAPLLSAGALPLQAGTAPDPAECAALWLGMLDVADEYPGYFGDMTNTRALAQAFEDQAGPQAAEQIAEERHDMALIAEAKVLGQDGISTGLFDRLAGRCSELEEAPGASPQAEGAAPAEE